MPNLRIGQKILIGVIAIFLLFAAGLSIVVGNSSSDDLTAIKQEELARMSQILARRVAEMEQSAATISQSMEQNEPIVREIELMTNLGPYYADPASYFADDFMRAGTTIEEADQIYVLQAQLKLVQLLQSAQRLNELTTISFYLIPPFDIAPEAKPVLALRLDEEDMLLTRFTEKINLDSRLMYQIDRDQFRPPPPDYFDISTAYSAPAAQFYEEQGFQVLEEQVEDEFFPRDWEEDAPPRSQIQIKDGALFLQTWYPVEASIAHPETWEEQMEPVGLALVEQKLDRSILVMLRNQLGLDVGFASGGQLLVSSLGGDDYTPMPDEGGPPLTLGQADFYYAQEPIIIPARKDDPSRSLDLQAVALSPVAEVREPTQRLVRNIGLSAIIGLILTSAVFYLGLEYIIGRPLQVLTRGVERVSTGDLSYEVPVQSQDELGQLASAFNSMSALLRELIGSLEERVEGRTQDLMQRARYLEATAAVARDAASELDLQDLLSRVVRLISERFGFYHAGIFLLDPTGEWAVLQAASSRGGHHMLNQGHRLKVGETGTVGYVTAKGKPRIALDVGADAVFFDNPDLPETRSAITLPLQARGEIIGALDVQSREPSAFTDEDAAVLQVLADQVAMAISNAQLFQQAQESLEAERKAYGELSRQAWAEMARSRANLGYLSDEHGTYPITAQSSRDDQTLEGVPPTAMDEVQRTEPAAEGPIVQNVQIDGKRLLIPIKVREQVVGTVGLKKPDGADEWSKGEVDLAENLIEQMNLALESARLYEDTQRRAARERMVSEITGRMRASLDPDTILKTTVRELGRALGAKLTSIEMTSSDGAQ